MQIKRPDTVIGSEFKMNVLLANRELGYMFTFSSICASKKIQAADSRLPDVFIYCGSTSGTLVVITSSLSNSTISISGVVYFSFILKLLSDNSAAVNASR